MEEASSWESVPSELLLEVPLGLVFSTQVVRTAFWFTLKATSAYFCAGRQRKTQMFSTSCDGTAYLPIVYGGLLGHELVDARASL